MIVVLYTHEKLRNVVDIYVKLCQETGQARKRLWKASLINGARLIDLLQVLTPLSRRSVLAAEMPYSKLPWGGKMLKAKVIDGLVKILVRYLTVRKRQDFDS